MYTVYYNKFGYFAAAEYDTFEQAVAAGRNTGFAFDIYALAKGTRTPIAHYGIFRGLVIYDELVDH